MQRLSVGVKVGMAEDDLCDALARLSIVPSRQASQNSIKAARKWAFMKEDGEVVAALQTEMIEDLMDDQIATKGHADTSRSSRERR